MNVMITFDFQIYPGIFFFFPFAPGNGLFYTVAFPEFNGFIHGDGDFFNLAGAVCRQCNGQNLIAKGNLPLIIMERRAAVTGIVFSWYFLRFMNVPKGDIVSFFGENITGKKIAAPQLPAAFRTITVGV